jgi:hypothetical protein
MPTIVEPERSWLFPEYQPPDCRTAPTSAGATGFTSREGRLTAVRAYLGYNAINVVESNKNGNYHSLQVAAQKRFQHDSLVKFCYTFRTT